MKKVLKYTGIFVGTFSLLVVAFITYLAVYPDLSKIRKRCNQIKVGMIRMQVEAIMGELLTYKSDRVTLDENYIYVMNNGVDCDIDFDTDNVVVKVTSAVDAL